MDPRTYLPTPTSLFNPWCDVSSIDVTPYSPGNGSFLGDGDYDLYFVSPPINYFHSNVLIRNNMPFSEYWYKIYGNLTLHYQESTY